MNQDLRQGQSDLVGRIAEKRDRVAFAILFDHYAPRLNAYFQRLGLDIGAAEELTQEVMIVLWRKAHLFDPAKSSLATWLYRIARNRRIDLARREKKPPLDASDPALLPEAPVEADVEIDIYRRERRIRAAVSELGEDQYALIRLAFFDGLSHSRIAEETGLPLGTVKSRIRLAFGHLRKVLESDPAVDTDA